MSNEAIPAADESAADCSIRASVRAAESFLQTGRNLADCCAELCAWNTTGYLASDGRVRELARLCAKYIGGADALPAAERMVARHAMMRVAAEV